MRTVVLILLGFAMLSVLGVLIAGLGGFVTGRTTPAQSNRLMQYRVLLQGIAVLLFGLLLYLLKR